jgi:uncharacterized RDD family membrane protein YckC
MRHVHVNKIHQESGTTLWINRENIKYYKVSFRDRVCALAIDIMLLLPLIYILKSIFFQADSAEIISASQQLRNSEITVTEFVQLTYINNGAYLFDIAMQLLTTFLLVWLWKRFAATPGKKLLGMQILSKNTLQPLSTWQAVTRAFGYLVSMLGMGIGFFWCVFDKYGQTWHDKISGSLVVYVQPHDDEWKQKNMKKQLIIAAIMVVAAFIILLIMQKMAATQ